MNTNFTKIYVGFEKVKKSSLQIPLFVNKFCFVFTIGIILLCEKNYTILRLKTHFSR